MTATTIQPKPDPGAAGVDQTMRIPDIAAHLLPDEIVADRRDRAARRISIMVLVAVTVGLAGWFGHATYETSVASDRLNLAEQQVSRLTRQQNTFADMTTAQAQSATIGRQLSTLLANDLPWSTLLTRLQNAAPATVRVTAVFGSLLASTAADASGGNPAAAPAVNPSAAPAEPAAGNPANPSATPAGQARPARQVGTLSVSATAPDEVAAAAYVDLLGLVPGLANPFVGDATAQEGALAFTVRLDITSVALEGRHTSQSAAPSGGS